MLRFEDCELFEIYHDSEGKLKDYESLKEVLEMNTNYDLAIPVTRTSLYVGFPTFLSDEQLEAASKIDGGLMFDTVSQLIEKYKLARKYFDNQKWQELTFLIERPFRFSFFYWIAVEHNVIHDKSLLFDVWTDAENPHINRNFYIDAFEKLCADGKTYVEDEYRDEFNALPDEIEIFRGVGPEEYLGHHELGLSWTLDKNVADWFSKRWKKSGHVLSKTVSKENVLYFTNCRGENEVVTVIKET